MVAASLMRPAVRGLTLGMLIMGWFASAVRQTDAQDANTYNSWGVDSTMKDEYDKAIA